MTIAELFQLRKNDPRWNTSYPLHPSDWEDYRVPGSLPFEIAVCHFTFIYLSASNCVHSANTLG